MQRILNLLLGINLLSYLALFFLQVHHPFLGKKEVYLCVSSMIVLIAVLKYFSKNQVGWKDNLLLIITVTYLTVSSFAKYNITGLTFFVIITFSATLLLVLLESYDWLKRKPKSQKMSLIQLCCLLSFFISLIFQIQHYAGVTIAIILFYFCLAVAALELVIKKSLISTNDTNN
jgi:hypothetical protein